MADKDPVNILLVDDLPAKLMSYEVILSGLGENLLIAGSAREAFEHLLRTEIAVVITDVSMPELDGFGLAAMIREHPRFQHIAIIFVSGIHLTDLDFLRGYQAGAVDYVSVPVIPEVLRAKVKVFVELYRKTRELERLNAELERRVAERTADLEKANADLEVRVVERTREREAALARVLDMQKMDSIGQLTGGVAHDFNNLLMVILGNLNLLKRHIREDGRATRLIDGAIAGAERGANLTKRMLAFARRQELNPETVDLRELVEGMTEMIRQSVGPNIQPTLTFGDGSFSVEVDRNQLELALLNLALNARDAMPGGGTLEINICRASRPGSSYGPKELICISVRDTGCGMDEETLKRAAEPFYTTKGVGKGTGLGLSMVHGLAAQSGGEMRLLSQLNKGTTVELWFQPTTRVHTASVAVEENPAIPFSALRILAVDDDPLVLSGTTAMLEDAGHSVVEAASGSEALELLSRGESFDLVITDQAMPKMSGTELAREIRRRWPTLPIILASGYAEANIPEELEVPRLAKPYNQAEVVMLIATVSRSRPTAGDAVATSTPAAASLQ